MPPCIRWPTMHPQQLYQIALTFISGIGPVKSRLLIAHCGNAEQVFKEKKSALQKIPEIGSYTAGLLHNKEALERAERELKFIEERGIQALFFTDTHYPERLKSCEDSPVLLYIKGKLNLNSPRVISVVGTRTATSYGKSFCAELLKGIKAYSPLVISGLAYGIDVCAHRNAVNEGLVTGACVAHGLDKVYPSLHASLALEMEKNGGLISEFPGYTHMTPELFPMRNRIIAGLSDCTIVVETDERGGSMITANLASSYGREVFALPGRYNDIHSSGCNSLIRKNLAAILTSPKDLIHYMNWDEPQTAVKQLNLFETLSSEEESIIRALQQQGKLNIDELSISTNIPFSRLSSLLLDLEFRGLVKSCPGKSFEVVPR
jgi:DNA processing protein